MARAPRLLGGQARSWAIGVATLLACALASPQARAAGEMSAQEYLRESQALYQSGQYFKAARYAFAAQEQDQSVEPTAFALVTLSLSRANLYNAASFFFIRTLQTGNKPAIRLVLSKTQDVLIHVGADLLRKYLIRHTTYEDYDGLNRSAYLYSLGKDALLSGREQAAVGYLSSVSGGSPLWPFALHLRGSAYAILNKNDEAIRDFEACQDKADDYAEAASDPVQKRALREEAEDLQARCQAGKARVLYQKEAFQEADRAYDRIPKESLVWPDILFEQAWNSFGKQEYNRTLGKLVTYKAPALEFVFNSEADVLRAQTFLSLCLYNDANQAINEFNAKYTKVGEQVKQFVESNANDLPAFYGQGKRALLSSLYTGGDFGKMLNRFVRSPYFQNLVAAERAVSAESRAIQQFNSMQPGVRGMGSSGFPGFLDLVLRWRLRTIQLLGGAFVKNSLLDYHGALIADFEKMAFIKLEMLSRAKEKLMYKNASSERSRGNVIPSRRDDQYYWEFNGEFWNDELGDYVFGLESECQS